MTPSHDDDDEADDMTKTSDVLNAICIALEEDLGLTFVGQGDETLVMCENDPIGPGVEYTITVNRVKPAVTP